MKINEISKKMGERSSPPNTVEYSSRDEAKTENSRVKLQGRIAQWYIDKTDISEVDVQPCILAEKSEAEQWADKLLNPESTDEEQIEALQKLGGLGKAAKKAITAVVNYFMNKEHYFVARAEAARTIGKITPAFVEDLKNKSTCMKALGTLVSIIEVLNMALTGYDKANKSYYTEWECVRQAAAEALYDIGEALVPALIEIINWDDDRIRENEEKQRIKNKAKDLFNRIIDIAIFALGDKSVKVQDCAIRALISIGQPALPKVTEAMRDAGNPNRRLGAIKVCYYIGADAQEALPELINRLADGDNKVSNGAFRTILNMGSAAVPALLKEVFRQKISIRKSIVIILGGMSKKEISQEMSEDIIRTLCEVLRSDKVNQIRVEAAEALGMWGKKAAGVFSALINIFEIQATQTSDDINLITAVAVAMVKIDAKRAENYLFGKLKDAGVNMKQRRVAVCALGELGNKVSPQVVDYIIENILIEKRGKMICLNSDKVDHFLLCASIMALGKMGSAAKNSVPRLNKLLEQAEKKVRNLESIKYINPNRYNTEKAFLDEIIWRTKETLEKINKPR